jgi:hypothetical protein
MTSETRCIISRYSFFVFDKTRVRISIQRSASPAAVSTQRKCLGSTIVLLIRS